MTSINPAVRNTAIKATVPTEAAKSVSITAAHEGQTIAVPAGSDFTISLDAALTAGFEWSVGAVDRTLGHPYKTDISNVTPGIIGGTARQNFTWSTDAKPLDKSGKHTITMNLRAPDAEGSIAKTFKVTVDIQAAPKKAELTEATATRINAAWSRAKKTADWTPGPFSKPGYEAFPAVIPTPMHVDAQGEIVFLKTHTPAPTGGILDPNDATDFYIQRTGGFGGPAVAQWAGPFALPGQAGCGTPTPGAVKDGFED